MMIVPQSAQRRTETPNAVMTTLVSPTLGGAPLSVWTVEMKPGQAGPEHLFEAEQIWTIQRGAALVDLGERTFRLTVGDTAIVPAGRLRRFHGTADSGFLALVVARAGRVLMPDGADRGVPAWIA